MVCYGYYAISLFLYFIYFIIIIGAEFLYQRYPDEDHWKITHPPPLNFPDSEVILFFRKYRILMILILGKIIIHQEVDSLEILVLLEIYGSILRMEKRLWIDGLDAINHYQIFEPYITKSLYNKFF